MGMTFRKNAGRTVQYLLLVLLTLAFLFPIVIVVMNAFKGRLYITDAPFALPTSETFSGFENFITGFTKIGFLRAFGYSLFITVGSVALIVLFTAMTAWYLVRVKNRLNTVLYYLFVFSMIVPFQMVMFTMTYIVNLIGFNNPVGILPIYLGFGSGLSVFMFSGFVKAVPMDVEEAACIDGCNPIQAFFRVVFPIMRPTAITVAILNAMWIWNDYLLPLLVIGNDYKTLPVAIQGVLTGSYGGKDMGALMAMLVLTIIPIIIFYLSCQKYIIKGVVAGAVKG